MLTGILSSKLLATQLARNGCRSFWMWINFVSNNYSRQAAGSVHRPAIQHTLADLLPLPCRVDHARREEVGAERSAAEWALRNGGRVKFTLFKNWTTDYNKIPSEAAALEAIDVSGMSVMDVGLEHLAGLQSLETMILRNCKYISDNGLASLQQVSQTLTALDLSGCVSITHRGLPHLYHLKKLTKLNLENTPSIKERGSSLSILKQNLPLCNVLE